MTKTYYVKVEATLYYDRNYEIEADDELKAGEIAEELAEREWNDNGIDTDFRRDWEFGHVMHEAVYAEESY
tara:strand:+ start:190 stop:402 length:213 start_codon:yes stop_codon:yes gene_type:complete